MATIIETNTTATNDQARIDYDICAVSYNDYGALPAGTLESQLIISALGDLTGLRVLDLGGGTGLHAREAIALGASLVDVVDISSEMLKSGEKIWAEVVGKNTGSVSADAIQFFEADVSKPIDHLPLRHKEYDVVMANWIWSFAETRQIAEDMVQNCAQYLKPGGLFVGTRDRNCRSPAIKEGKYGCTAKWTKEVPGGLRWYTVLHTDPPAEFEGITLEIIDSGSPEIFEKFGLEGVEAIPYEKTKVVNDDKEFWKLFLDHPYFDVIKATKKAG